MILSRISHFFANKRVSIMHSGTEKANGFDIHDSVSTFEEKIV